MVVTMVKNAFSAVQNVLFTVGSSSLKNSAAADTGRESRAQPPVPRFDVVVQRHPHWVPVDRADPRGRETPGRATAVRLLTPFKRRPWRPSYHLRTAGAHCDSRQATSSEPGSTHSMNTRRNNRSVVGSGGWRVVRASENATTGCKPPVRMRLERRR